MSVLIEVNESSESSFDLSMLLDYLELKVLDL